MVASLWFGESGFNFAGQGLGSRLSGLGSRFRATCYSHVGSCFAFRVLVFEIVVYGLWNRVSGFGFRTWGFGIRVRGLWFGSWGFGIQF